MADDLTLRDYSTEERIYYHRIIVSLIIVLIALGCLVARMVYLQVDQYEFYSTKSNKNRIHTQAIPPTRGLIYDRTGALLADNSPSFQLAITKEHVKSLDETIAELRSIVEISEDDEKGFYKKLRSGERKPYEAVALKKKLSESDIAKLVVNQYRLPGVEVKAILVRSYPEGSSFSHAIGYVGRINEREEQKVDKENYQGTEHIGKTGVELRYENLLHGKVGYEEVETNAHGRVLRVLSRTEPEPGHNLTLHLHTGLQKKAEELLEERRAALVAIEPDSGGILAMVSTPAYDPNLFVTGIDPIAYRSLRDDPDRPLYNRALQGLYPPGSTIKPVVAFAALDSDTVSRDYTINDPGWFRLPGVSRMYRDWSLRVLGGGHGRVDVRSAIYNSCDTYFYDVAHKMGIDTLTDYFRQFGFGEITSLDVVQVQKGIRPSREWKRAARGQAWYPGDTVNIGIGQGVMLMNPLQMATMTSLLANEGKWVRPRFLKRINRAAYQTPADETFPDIQIKRQKDWDIVIQGMIDVVHGARGTARRSGQGAKYKIAGKTGTAQVKGIAQNETYDATKVDKKFWDHALFVGFAPAENPKIAAAVIVENSGGGSKIAAPIIRVLFDYYLLEALEMQFEEEKP